MDSKEYLGWCVVKNTVKDRLSDGILAPQLLSSGRKIQNRTKLLNEAIEREEIETYSQYRELKKKCLKETAKHADESGAADTSKITCVHKVNDVTIDMAASNDCFKWRCVEKKGRKKKRVWDSKISEKVLESFMRLGATVPHKQNVRVADNQITDKKNDKLSSISKVNRISIHNDKQKEKNENSSHESIVENTINVVKRDLISAKNNELSDKNSEFVPYDIQAQSTKLFSDTFSEKNQNGLNRPSQNQRRNSVILENDEDVNLNLINESNSNSDENNEKNLKSKHMNEMKESCKGSKHIKVIKIINDDKLTNRIKVISTSSPILKGNAANSNLHNEGQNQCKEIVFNGTLKDEDQSALVEKCNNESDENQNHSKVKDDSQSILKEINKKKSGNIVKENAVLSSSENTDKNQCEKIAHISRSTKDNKHSSLNRTDSKEPANIFTDDSESCSENEDEGEERVYNSASKNHNQILPKKNDNKDFEDILKGKFVLSQRPNEYEGSIYNTSNPEDNNQSLQKKINKTEYKNLDEDECKERSQKSSDPMKEKCGNRNVKENKKLDDLKENMVLSQSSASEDENYEEMSQKRSYPINDKRSIKKGTENQDLDNNLEKNKVLSQSSESEDESKEMVKKSSHPKNDTHKNEKGTQSKELVSNLEKNKVLSQNSESEDESEEMDQKSSHPKNDNHKTKKGTENKDLVNNLEKIKVLSQSSGSEDESKEMAQESSLPKNDHRTKKGTEKKDVVNNLEENTVLSQSSGSEDESKEMAQKSSHPKNDNYSNRKEMKNKELDSNLEENAVSSQSSESEDESEEMVKKSSRLKNDTHRTKKGTENKDLVNNLEKNTVLSQSSKSEDESQEMTQKISHSKNDNHVNGKEIENEELDNNLEDDMVLSQSSESEDEIEEMVKKSTNPKNDTHRTKKGTENKELVHNWEENKVLSLSSESEDESKEKNKKSSHPKNDNHSNGKERENEELDSNLEKNPVSSESSENEDESKGMAQRISHPKNHNHGTKKGTENKELVNNLEENKVLSQSSESEDEREEKDKKSSHLKNDNHSNAKESENEELDNNLEENKVLSQSSESEDESEEKDKKSSHPKNDNRGNKKRTENKKSEETDQNSTDRKDDSHSSEQEANDTQSDEDLSDHENNSSLMRKLKRSKSPYLVQQYEELKRLRVFNGSSTENNLNVSDEDDQSVNHLSQFAAKDNLKKKDSKSTFAIDDISPDEEIFIINVPKHHLDEKLVSKKIKVSKSKIIIGHKKYEARGKTIVPSLTCVLKNKNSNFAYQTVNIRPSMELIATQSKLKEKAGKGISVDTAKDRLERLNEAKRDSKIENSEDEFEVSKLRKAKRLQLPKKPVEIEMNKEIVEEEIKSENENIQDNVDQINNVIGNSQRKNHKKKASHEKVETEKSLTKDVSPNKNTSIRKLLDTSSSDILRKAKKMKNSKLNGKEYETEMTSSVSVDKKEDDKDSEQEQFCQQIGDEDMENKNQNNQDNVNRNMLEDTDEKIEIEESPLQDVSLYKCISQIEPLCRSDKDKNLYKAKNKKKIRNNGTMYPTIVVNNKDGGEISELDKTESKIETLCSLKTNNLGKSKKKKKKKSYCEEKIYVPEIHSSFVEDKKEDDEDSVKELEQMNQIKLEHTKKKNESNQDTFAEMFHRKYYNIKNKAEHVLDESDNSSAREISSDKTLDSSDKNHSNKAQKKKKHKLSTKVYKKKDDQNFVHELEHKQQMTDEEFESKILGNQDNDFNNVHREEIQKITGDEKVELEKLPIEDVLPYISKIEALHKKDKNLYKAKKKKKMNFCLKEYETDEFPCDNVNQKDDEDLVNGLDQKQIIKDDGLEYQDNVSKNKHRNDFKNKTAHELVELDKSPKRSTSSSEIAPIIDTVCTFNESKKNKRKISDGKWYVSEVEDNHKEKMRRKDHTNKVKEHESGRSLDKYGSNKRPLDTSNDVCSHKDKKKKKNKSSDTEYEPSFEVDKKEEDKDSLKGYEGSQRSGFFWDVDSNSDDEEIKRKKKKKKNFQLMKTVEFDE